MKGGCTRASSPSSTEILDDSPHTIIAVRNQPRAIAMAIKAPDLVPEGEPPTLIPPGESRSVRRRPRLSIDTSKHKNKNPFYFPCGNSLQNWDSNSEPAVISFVKSGFVEDVVTPLNRVGTYPMRTWPCLRDKSQNLPPKLNDVSCRGMAPPDYTSTSSLPERRGGDDDGDLKRRVTFAPSGLRCDVHLSNASLAPSGLCTTEERMNQR